MMSRNTDRNRRRRPTLLAPGARQSLSRYDLLLASIPLAFALALFAAGVLGVSTRLAVIGGSLVSLSVLVDALFVNPPL